MSVFYRVRNEINPALICSPYHRWNNERPVVNKDILEVQHPELIGVPCDCGRILYDEGPCGCSKDEWRVIERLP